MRQAYMETVCPCGYAASMAETGPRDGKMFPGAERTLAFRQELWYMHPDLAIPADG
jgi:hypothetical protein